MIAAEFTFPDLVEKVRANERRIGEEVIVAMQTNRGMLFDAEGNYNGHEAWSKPRLREGQALANRGVLKKSLAPGTDSGAAGPGGIATIDGQKITIGTDVAYAAMMNFGTVRMPDGIMRPVRAKALRIPLPAGKKATKAAKTLRKTSDEGFIYRKWVRIPERRFDTITQADRDEFNAAFAAAVAEVMRG